MLIFRPQDVTKRHGFVQLSQKQYTGEQNQVIHLTQSELIQVNMQLITGEWQTFFPSVHKAQTRRVVETPNLTNQEDRSTRVCRGGEQKKRDKIKT